MTINEIKIEALKLMFTNYSEDIDNVDMLYNDDNYSAYIMSMNGAINRALARLWAKRIIRNSFVPLPTSFAVDNTQELEDAITPPDKERVHIPIDVQLLIPYYIKADLYEEDEPALAAQARNIFEQSIDDRRDEDEQEQLVNVFRQGWLG